MIRPDDLIAHAYDLVRKKRGRPKEMSLRRATSAAYYAVFHAVSQLVADELVGRSRAWDTYVPIYRSLDHSGAKAMFRKCVSNSIDGFKDIPAMNQIGQTFVDLQEQRHVADYDPCPFNLGRESLVGMIKDAEDAIAKLETLPKKTRLLLAAKLVSKQRP